MGFAAAQGGGSGFASAQGLAEGFQPAQGAVWTPLNISGCVLWLDPSDRSTITTSSGNVTQWDDKGPNGYAFQEVKSSDGYPVNANLPADSTLNSLGAVEFDSANSEALWTKSITPPIVDAPYEILIVVNKVNDSDRQIVLEVGDASTGQDGILIQMQEFGLLAMYCENWVNQIVTTDTYSAATTHIVGGRHVTSTSRYARLDGADSAEGTVSQSPSGDQDFVCLGTLNVAPISATQWYSGKIGEVVVYNRVLTAGERSTLETYLADKWGVTLS